MLVFLLIRLLSGEINTFFTSFLSGMRGPTRKRPCCVDVTNLDMSPEVVGETYREQASSHPCVKAIIFNTEYGQLCSDPKAQWVQDLTAKMTKV
uniref:Chemokine interleukin-8-like domain-containing protein n=1 Tax=Oreochromis niloticus TaxID=8128 RepID=A0A669B9V4_ORENI